MGKGRKEMVVELFDVPVQHFPGGTEENHEVDLRAEI
jgi:hypothetical protein